VNTKRFSFFCLIYCLALCSHC